MRNSEHLTTDSPKPVFPDDGVLKLYSMRFCPYAHRVHLVLEAKKIPHHTIYINLREKPRWFPQVSRTSKVPALELVGEPGNTVLTESLIICDYLEDKYPDVAPLYPKDPVKRAQEKILVERFGDLMTTFHRLIFCDHPDTNAYAGLGTYEEELKQRGTKFFGGAAPGMLDYMIWPWCERFSVVKLRFGDSFDLSPERFGTLIKWRDSMLQDPAVKSLYLDGESYHNYMESRRHGNTDYNIKYNTAKRARLD